MKLDTNRLVWLVAAMIALSIPLWYEIAGQPGNWVFAWRWTEHQNLVESIVSVVHFVIVVAGVFMLKKAAGDLPQWNIVRLGAWIWAALVGLFAIFSVLMFNMGEYTMVEELEGEGYRITFVRMSGTAEDQTQIFGVLSCNHTVLYKNILHIERLVGVDDVRARLDDDVLRVVYLSGEREAREETYDIEDFYQQCRESR